MSKIAILTDSNSGITQDEAKELGVFVIPMPFYIDGNLFYEDIDLTQDEFYEKLTHGGDITTSMPIVGNLMDTWDDLLKKYDEILYIPMSSGLSSSCATATNLAEDEYEDKVFVADLQRISVTMKQAVMEAKALAEAGNTANDIKNALEHVKFDSRIYIMVDTLEYLKKGGRLTPAVAAIGSLLKIKPVLQIKGEKLDTFSKGRTVKQCKQIMIDAIAEDLENVLHDPKCENSTISMAYSNNYEAADEFRKEVENHFGVKVKYMDPLSLSISCHIGPGALAVTCTKNLV